MMATNMTTTTNAAGMTSIANPELRRNLWLEITTTRLWVMPLVLGALFALMKLGDFAPTTASRVFLGVFVALVFLWGTRLAGDSIVCEIRDRTWDAQRLSSISPWALGWGKLVGSTAYAWYGGLLCLVAYYLSVPPDAPRRDEIVALLVLGGFLVQTATSFMSLVALARNRSVSRAQSSSLALMALLVFAAPLVIAWPDSPVRWYGLTFEPMTAVLSSLALFLFWALVGLHRQMRTELMFRSAPWVFTAFAIFLMLYVGGWSAQFSDGHAQPWLATLWLAAGLTWLAVVVERKDPVALRCLWRDASERRWQALLESLPCWVVAWLLFAVSVLMVVLLSSLGVISGIAPPPIDHGAVESATAAVSTVSATASLVSMVFFVARDIALVLFSSLSRRPRRADLFAVLCLGLLYGLAPAILSAVGLTKATALFWPRTDEGALSLLAAVCECALLWWLVSRRWGQPAGNSQQDS